MFKFFIKIRIVAVFDTKWINCFNSVQIFART